MIIPRMGCVFSLLRYVRYAAIYQWQLTMALASIFGSLTVLKAMFAVLLLWTALLNSPR